ncbi:Glutamine synthetase [Balamuthia mandrillaris]
MFSKLRSPQSLQLKPVVVGACSRQQRLNWQRLGQVASYSSSTESQRKENVKEALEYAKKQGAQMVDFKFTDLYGSWQHIQVHAANLDEGAFRSGFGFDGSSIRGWQPINQSDMLILPDPKTRMMDPFAKHPTVSFVCDVVDPVTKEPYHKDPRHVANKAIQYLRSTGVAHECAVGPEAEFFVFDSVAFSVKSDESFYRVNSEEASWTSSQPHSGHYKIRPKEGYFPVKPWDNLQDLRSEMALEMVKLGLHVEASHHEVASAGQCEIDIRFGSLVEMADAIQLYKYVVKNVAARNNKIVSFMPKPIAADNGSGMHTHVSLHKPDGTNLFTGDQYAGLSDMALYFIGGLIKHAQAVCAITNPGINSYKRLVPGFEAPVNMAYSGRNRSAAIRIPISHPKARRLEFRTPDPSCNPYLSFSAILMAGLDGIQNKYSPGAPLEKDIYSLSDEELSQIVKAPRSLEEAINALEQDHEFLTRGNVFSKDLIETWVSRKRQYEIDPYRKLPTPFEFQMYYDC